MPLELTVGDTVDVYVERYEDRDGNIRLSREKARREEAWFELEKAFNNTERVNGVIFGRVKGGFIVDLSGAVPSYQAAKSIFARFATLARLWELHSLSKS